MDDDKDGLRFVLFVYSSNNSFTVSPTILLGH